MMIMTYRWRREAKKKTREHLTGRRLWSRSPALARTQTPARVSGRIEVGKGVGASAEHGRTVGVGGSRVMAFVFILRKSLELLALLVRVLRAVGVGPTLC